MYVMRAFGGLLYLSGALIMVVNVWRTILGHRREEAPMTETSFDAEADRPLAPSPALQPAE
jgi:cytochrome c oxidase cbb3-type subunit 1